METLKDALSKAQDGYNNVTRLLEDQSKDKESGAGEWEKSMRAVEARISNQEKESKETKEKAQKILRQNQSLKRALEAEKNKSVWKKLFG